MLATLEMSRAAGSSDAFARVMQAAPRTGRSPLQNGRLME